jgi:hypothetical protein
VSIKGGHTGCKCLFFLGAFREQKMGLKRVAKTSYELFDRDARSAPSRRSLV